MIPFRGPIGALCSGLPTERAFSLLFWKFKNRAANSQMREFAARLFLSFVSAYTII